MTDPTPDALSLRKEEHARILDVVRRMASRKERSDLLEDVRSLTALLPEHFREEARAGGLFPESLARAPEADHQIQALLIEHAEILADLEALHDELEAEEDGVIEDRLADAGALARTIEDHEERESRLLARIWFADATGGGD